MKIRVILPRYSNLLRGSFWGTFFAESLALKQSSLPPTLRRPRSFDDVGSSGCVRTSHIRVADRFQHSQRLVPCVYKVLIPNFRPLQLFDIKSLRGGSLLILQGSDHGRWRLIRQFFSPH